MAARTGEMTRWTEDELLLIEMFASMPNLTDLAEILGRKYNVVKAKVHDVKKNSIIRSCNYDVGAKTRFTSEKNLKDIEEANIRAIMLASIKQGQTLVIKEKGQIMCTRVRVVSNNGNFITCKILGSNRIVTLNRGEVITKQTLISVVKDLEGWS